MFGFFKSHKDAWWMAGVDVEWDSFAAAKYMPSKDKTVTAILDKILDRYGTTFPQRMAAGVVSLCFANAVKIDTNPEVYFGMATQPNGRALLSRAFQEWLTGDESGKFIDDLLRECGAEIKTSGV